MKKVIRRGVFETNSSSCHSISLGASKNIDKNLLKPNSDGLVIGRLDSFGWKENSFTDAYTKLNYLITYLCSEFAYYSDKVKKYIGDDGYLMWDIFSSHKLEKLVELDNIIRKNTGGKLEIKFTEGYIDHQSLEVAEDIFNNNEIENFIFNKSSVLTTDHDNH